MVGEVCKIHSLVHFAAGTDLLLLARKRNILACARENSQILHAAGNAHPHAKKLNKGAWVASTSKRGPYDYHMTLTGSADGGWVTQILLQKQRYSIIRMPHAHHDRPS